ncbi:MAG: enoyl-CoA hydratase/isomerase family protein [Betaproteobacteria bacterium]|nr:enoyl-CoA hydratase/isomerase family protein [Betaproteobacteria bacterium]
MSTRLSCRSLCIEGVAFGEVTLSSANGVNPLSLSAVRALREQLAALAGPQAPHGLVIRAEGRFFCAGADVKEFRDFDADRFRGYMTEVLGLYADLIDAPRPILSLVQADALGAGAALALCSDFVLAADPVRFAFPEAQRGLAGGGYLMPRLIGRQRAAEMVLLGRPLSAQRAEQLGLVNEVCAPEAFAARTRAWLAEIAAIAPGAFAVGKRSLAGGLSVDLRQAMDWHVQAQTEAFIQARDAQA